MDAQQKLEQLWIFLSERAAFWIVYRVRAEPNAEVRLELHRGASAYGDSVPEIAAIYNEIALGCYRRAVDGIMPWDTTRQPTPEGRRWRGLVVASGATRSEGYAIMVTLRAKDDAEMEQYHSGIHRIMAGEPAKDVPRPGGY